MQIFCWIGYSLLRKTVLGGELEWVLQLEWNKPTVPGEEGDLFFHDGQGLCCRYFLHPWTTRCSRVELKLYHWIVGDLHGGDGGVHSFCGIDKDIVAQRPYQDLGNKSFQATELMAASNKSEEATFWSVPELLNQNLFGSKATTGKCWYVHCVEGMWLI